MKINTLRTVGAYIMLWSILAAAFRYNELYVYGVFGIGFFITLLGLGKRTISPQAILAASIPIVALHVSLPVPTNLPVLIRLGVTIGIWLIVLLVASVICSVILKKRTNNHTR